MSKVLKAHLALITVNLIYGANYIIAKEVTPEYILPFGFIVIRVSMALPMFWILHFILHKSGSIDKPSSFSKREWLTLAACGLFGVAINQLMFFKGLSLTTPINASLIMITTPILVLLFAALLIGEKITVRKAIGMFVGCFGAALIILKGSSSTAPIQANIQGDLLIFINASSYALYLVLVKPLMQKHHPITIIKWVFLFGFLYVLPIGWNEFSQIDWQRMEGLIILAVVYVVVCTTFMTYFLNIYALEKVETAIVSSYIFTQPIIATTIAISFDKDYLSFEKMLGALAIFIGVYLVSFSRNNSLKQA